MGWQSFYGENYKLQMTNYSPEVGKLMTRGGEIKNLELRIKNINYYIR